MSIRAGSNRWCSSKGEESQKFATGMLRSDCQIENGVWAAGSDLEVDAGGPERQLRCPG